MIRALVFDFDGLVIDTEKSFIDAYGDVHARHGVPFDPKHLLNEVGQIDYSFDPWHAFPKGADRAALEAERQQRNRELNQELPVLPGVVPLLDDARAAGLRLGAASNAGRPHVEGHLGRVGLLPRFEFIACREDVPSPKPEPDVYRHVLRRFGLNGREAIAFEDSPIGVLSAKRAGMWVVAVPNGSTAHHDFAHAHLRVPSLVAVKLADLLARFGPAAAN